MMNRYQVIQKVSLNIGVISTTLLGGYLLCDNSILNPRGVGLATTCVLSGITFMKTYPKSNKRK